ncbi:MAG TPA: PIG-L family deacetylase [Thermoanaerobaculia bacterium]|nr:PIG-L family deacetylase [Thermoanaerobaculia bacterium]
MSDAPTLERLLIVAPHPDDDAIGAGGLIQRAVAGGAKLRVVIATDGENNPWPQRVMHKKLVIRKNDRARWGAMRREEALEALARLGVERDAARFLGFPDNQVATLARAGCPRVLDALRAVIDEFQPTLIVSPSSRDLHADHRALAYFVHRAAGEAVPIVTYVIHGDPLAEQTAVRLHLTPREQLWKRQAIECHKSQLLLSRERFLSYARPVESFYAAEHDAVHADTWSEEWTAALRHAGRVLFGSYDPGDSGVQPAADVQDGAGDVAGLL